MKMKNTKMKNTKHTYELWFLGDIVGEPQPKNRATLNTLLQEAHQMLADALPIMIGGCNGAEIVHREHKFGHCTWDETVWEMSLDEFKKAQAFARATGSKGTRVLTHAERMER